MLPHRRYVPGLGLHPSRDPDHLLPHPHRLDDSVQFAVDCINHRYAWCAHELLEARWLELRPSLHASTLQGLLQVAVSSLLLHLGRVPAALRVRARASVRLQAGLEVLQRYDIDGPQLLRDLDPCIPWPVLQYPQTKTMR